MPLELPKNDDQQDAFELALINRAKDIRAKSTAALEKCYEGTGGNFAYVTFILQQHYQVGSLIENAEIFYKIGIKKRSTENLKIADDLADKMDFNSDLFIKAEKSRKETGRSAEIGDVRI